MHDELVALRWRLAIGGRAPSRLELEEALLSRVCSFHAPFVRTTLGLLDRVEEVKRRAA